MSDAKRSGNALEAMSAKMACKPSASISGNPIPSNGTLAGRCIATGSPTKEPSPRGLRPKVLNARAKVSFQPRAKFFLQYARMTRRLLAARLPNGNGMWHALMWNYFGWDGGHLRFDRAK